MARVSPRGSGVCDWNSWIHRAAEAVSRGDFVSALEDYDRAIRIKPDLGSAYAGRAHVQASMGDREGALSDYDKAISYAPSAIKFRTRARLRLSLGDVKGALSDFDSCISLDPSFADRANQFAADFADRANSKLLLGDHLGAIDDCDQAIALDSACAQAHLARAVAHQALGDISGKARHDFDCALALDPNLISAYTHRGRLQMSQGNLQGALADFVTWRWLARTESPSLLVDMGSIKQRLGRLDDARLDYDAAIHLDPLCAVAYHLRGKLHLLFGAENLALFDFDTAIRLDASFAAAYASREALLKRRGWPPNCRLSRNSKNNGPEFKVMI